MEIPEITLNALKAFDSAIEEAERSIKTFPALFASFNADFSLHPASWSISLVDSSFRKAIESKQHLILAKMCYLEAKNLCQDESGNYQPFRI